MNIDGIWRVEMLGIHGWETFSTSYFEKGRYTDGGAHGYAVGRYDVSGEDVAVQVTLKLYGTGLTVFGRDSGTIEMVYEGKVDDGQILGIASNGEYRMHFRGTRVADLPRVAGG
jgi:hypothetical protein